MSKTATPNTIEIDGETYLKVKSLSNSCSVGRLRCAFFTERKCPNNCCQHVIFVTPINFITHRIKS